MSITGLLQPVIRHGLGYGKRREEKRRWEQYGAPLAQQRVAESKARWGEGGIEQRKIALDEDTLKQRTHEFTKSLDER